MSILISCEPLSCCLHEPSANIDERLPSLLLPGNTTRFLLMSSSTLPPSLPAPVSGAKSTSGSHLTAVSFPSLSPSSLSAIVSPALISLDRRPAQGGENETDGGGFRSGWLAVYQTCGAGSAGSEDEWWTSEAEVACRGGISLGVWSARD